MRCDCKVLGKSMCEMHRKRSKTENTYEEKVRKTLRTLGFHNVSGTSWWQIEGFDLSINESDIDNAKDIVFEIWNKAKDDLAEKINTHQNAIKDLLTKFTE